MFSYDIPRTKSRLVVGGRDQCPETTMVPRLLISVDLGRFLRSLPTKMLRNSQHRERRNRGIVSPPKPRHRERRNRGIVNAETAAS
jgi:hypothetical protein